MRSLTVGNPVWSAAAAKPEWGIKRTCLSCAVRFYDMRRNPIVCPSCGATFEPDASLKSRRSRSAPEAVAKPVVAAVAPKAPEPEVEAAEAEGPQDEEALAADAIVELDDDDEADDAVIEDTGDLAEDDDAIPAVAPKDEKE